MPLLDVKFMEASVACMSINSVLSPLAISTLEIVYALFSVTHNESLGPYAISQTELNPEATVRFTNASFWANKFEDVKSKGKK